MSNKYEPEIGLEVHIQLNTKSKMVCGFDNNSDAKEPNPVVCPVCFGMPGTLPVANKEAIFKTLLLATAIKSNLAESWYFERKNYFYPDLPKGYQITSSTQPPAIGGKVDVPNGENNAQFSVEIHHLHLEEDAGKLLHGNNGYSLVDLNRCGTPLIELVTEPCLHRPEDAKMFLKEMQTLVRRLGISDADMEKGHMRCDANVSLRKVGEKTFGKKVEVKNLNSFRMVERALNYEIERQGTLLERGEEIHQETRGWNDNKSITTSQRGKEEVHDYRYLPDPDLPPIRRLEVTDFLDEKLTRLMPELPQQLRERLTQEYNLDARHAELCIDDPHFYNLFNEVAVKLPISVGVDYLSIMKNLMFGNLYRVVQEKQIDLSKSKTTSNELLDLVTQLAKGTVNQNSLKNNIGDYLSGKIGYPDLLSRIAKNTEINLDDIIAETMKESVGAVNQYKEGDQKVFGFLIGRVMAKTQGRADPREVDQKLRRILEQT